MSYARELTKEMSEIFFNAENVYLGSKVNNVSKFNGFKWTVFVLIANVQDSIKQNCACCISVGLVYNFCYQYFIYQWFYKKKQAFAKLTLIKANFKYLKCKKHAVLY